jgi:hypothetical protein
MRRLYATAATAVLVMSVGCSETPVEPHKTPPPGPSFQTAAKGTGLVLNSLTGLSLPLIGQLGTVTINQAEITHFALIENTVGAIVGLEVDGVLQLTGGVLGTNVVTQNFSTTASVTSSGPGQCNLVSINLGPVAINALNLATVDLPTASITGKGSGAVGSLLCNLGNLLSGLLSGGTGSPGAQGVVNALNNQIGG